MAKTRTKKKQPPSRPPAVTSSHRSISSANYGSCALKVNNSTSRPFPRKTDDGCGLNFEKESAVTKTLATAVVKKSGKEVFKSEEEASDYEELSDPGLENGEENIKEMNSGSESERPLSPYKLYPAIKAKEEEDGGSESEEEEFMPVNVSEEILNADPKENPRFQPQDSQYEYEGEYASKSSSSSGPATGNDEKDIDTIIADSLLEPLSFGKRSAASPSKILNKKRTADAVDAEASHEKERFERIWSNEDELTLLQGILKFKEQHHIIPYTVTHSESILNSMKDSLSFSVSVSQISDKLRRLRRRYKNTATRISRSKQSNIIDPHNAAVYDLSRKIWDSLKKESFLLGNKLSLIKMEKAIDKNKRVSNHFAKKYPYLHRCLEGEHANDTLLVQGHIPIASSKELEEKCQKMEMTNIHLNMKKLELLSSAMKLIVDTLAKC